MTATPPLLDAALIRTRRISLGLSERDVAKRLGVTAQVIASLERGRNHADVSAALVCQLAGLLAVEPADLLTTPPRLGPQQASEAADTEALGALLATEATLVPVATLALVLEWEPERVAAGLAGLDTALGGCGQRLHWLGNDVKIIPAGSVVSTELVARLTRRSFARRGMSLAQARLLRQAALGTLTGSEHGNADRVALATLVNAGLVTFAAGDARGGRPTLSPDSQFSLSPPSAAAAQASHQPHYGNTCGET
jgi:transcriptional regulator with XRE-family HTH domain